MLFSSMLKIASPFSPIVVKATEKMKKGEMRIEDILSEDELVMDLRNQKSKLVTFVTKEHILGFLKYALCDPEKDDTEHGYRYPFSASEVLSGENNSIHESFFGRFPEEDDDYPPQENVGPLSPTPPGGDTCNPPKWTKKAASNDKSLIMDEIRKVVEKISSINLYDDEGNGDQGEGEGERDDEKKKNENTEIIISTTNIQLKDTKFEIFDCFLSFLDQDEDLNYVLAGYFSKIFLTLKSSRPDLMLPYLFLLKKEYFHKMIKHLNRKAIADLLGRLLLTDLSQICPESEITAQTENQLKYEILDNIIESFKCDDEERAENICDMLIECIKNRKFFIMIMENEMILRRLYSLLELNFLFPFSREILKMLLKINENVREDMERFPDFEFEDEFCEMSPEEKMISMESIVLDLRKCEYFFEIISSQIELLTEDYTLHNQYSSSTTLSSTFDQPMKVLGMNKLLEFNYITSIIGIISMGSNLQTCPSLSSFSILSNIYTHLMQFNFFKYSIDDFFQFEWNNSYQKSFSNLLKNIFSYSHSNSIVDHMITELKFLESILHHALNIKFVFNSGKQINSGYLPYLISISHGIFTTRNIYLKETVAKNLEWSQFVLNFVEPIHKRFLQKLKYEKLGEFCILDPQNDGEVLQRNFIESIRQKNLNGKVNKSISNGASIDNDNCKQSGEFFDNCYWNSFYLFKRDQECENFVKDLL